MEKVIVVISNPQECGDYTINFISTFDGEIMKKLAVGNANYGFYNYDELLDDNNEYVPQKDTLANELLKSYGIKLPKTKEERYAITQEDIAKMIAKKMQWQILAIYRF